MKTLLLFNQDKAKARTISLGCTRWESEAVRRRKSKWRELREGRESWEREEAGRERGEEGGKIR